MYFIDVQGTLIDDINRLPIEGAIEFLDYLNAHNIAYIVITNNTKRTSRDFLAYLNSIGLKIPKEKYLDPLMTLSHLHVDNSRIAAFGSSEFLEVLKAENYHLTNEDVECVIVASKEDFIADEYALMIDALLKGARLIAMHETSIYAKNSKRYPGVGAIAKMLEFATSTPYVVVGKPSETFYKRGLHMIQEQKPLAKFSDITIISDDVKGDLVGAQHLGMKSVFVLSGKYKSSKEIIPKLDKNDRPHEIYENIGQYKGHI